MTNEGKEDPGSAIKKYVSPRALRIFEMDDGQGTCVTGADYTGDYCLTGYFAASCNSGQGAGVSQCNPGSGGSCVYNGNGA